MEIWRVLCGFSWKPLLISRGKFEREMARPMTSKRHCNRPLRLVWQCEHSRSDIRPDHIKPVCTSARVRFGHVQPSVAHTVLRSIWIFCSLNNSIIFYKNHKAGKCRCLLFFFPLFRLEILTFLSRLCVCLCKKKKTRAHP